MRKQKVDDRSSFLRRTRFGMERLNRNNALGWINRKRSELHHYTLGVGKIDIYTNADPSKGDHLACYFNIVADPKAITNFIARHLDGVPEEKNAG